MCSTYALRAPETETVALTLRTESDPERSVSRRVNGFQNAASFGSYCCWLLQKGLYLDLAIEMEGIEVLSLL